MASISDSWQRLGPAAFVLQAIIVAAVADALLLAFILLRRAYRKRYFAKHDTRVLEFHKKWEALISGEIPFETWRQKPFDRRIVETIVLDAFEVAGPEESARLLKFLRNSGLIEKLIFDARHHRGWRRRRALVSLGRTRAPEGIPALSEGLRDANLETRLAALRGLGRTACPQAGEEILTWLGEVGLAVPAMPLQTALIHCCAEQPQVLLPYLQHTAGPLREVLGRVLGEVATPSLGMDLLQFAEDNLDELRAAAARALSHAQPGPALEVLSELARDPVWFVRLRAIVSLGNLDNPNAILPLLGGLTDSNRLVRLRAGEALVKFKIGMVPIFQQTAATQDRYGLHAYLTALENANLRQQLEEELQASKLIKVEKEHLLEVLRTARLSAVQNADMVSVAAATSERQP